MDLCTKGDSAKALAVSGLSVVGRDHYGVFPLKGKMLNVREANHKQIIKSNFYTQFKRNINEQYAKLVDADEEVELFGLVNIVLN